MRDVHPAFDDLVHELHVWELSTKQASNALAGICDYLVLCMVLKVPVLNMLKVNPTGAL